MAKLAELTEAVGHLPDAEIGTLAVHCLTSIPLGDKIKAIMDSLEDTDERDELVAQLEDWKPEVEEEDEEEDE